MCIRDRRAVARFLHARLSEAGAEETSHMIVAGGANSARPHHRPGEHVLAVGDLLLLDFGCVVEGYHSDLTRTVALGEPGARLRECLLYTSPSPRDRTRSRMPSS